MQLASLLIGHNTLGSGDDSDTQALQDAGHLLSTSVNTQAGLGNAAQAGDNLLLLSQVLQGDVDDALVAIVNDGVGLDVALVQQDLSNSLLQVGSRYIHSVVLSRVGVPDSGQHICYGIGDLHVKILLLEVTGLTRQDVGVSGECDPVISHQIHLPGTNRTCFTF